MRRNTGWMLALCCLLGFASLPQSAGAKETNTDGKFSAKDEVIYGNLDANGTTKEMYVVNTFRVSKSGQMTDYGNYTDIRNLTDLSDINQTKNQVTFEANQDEFYYQGKLADRPLPWDISITYYINDKKINPAELAGESGHLQIQIKTAANDEIDPLFFEYYMLQISLSLDPLYFQNIQAPAGVEANEGKNKNITFSVMPGEAEELILSADVSNLKMDPIDITAIPANIAMEDPDISGMTSEMQELVDGISDVHDGVTQIHDGLASLDGGARELESGSGDFKNGLSELDATSGKLIDGSDDILQAMKDISNAMENSPNLEEFERLNQLEELPQSLREAAKEIKNFATDLESVDNELGDLPGDAISDEEIEELLRVLKDNDSDGNLSGTIGELEGIIESVKALTNLDQVIPGDAIAEIREMASQLEGLADEIESGMNSVGQLEDLTKLQDGLTTMAKEYETFHNGLIRYTDGVHELAVSYQDLDEGIKDISAGLSALEDGAAELKTGTKELKEATDDLPGTMKSEMNELLAEYDFSDFEQASYVSEKNKHVDVVQFVLQTEKLEVIEPEISVEKPKEKSLWDRFLDLF